MADDLGDDIVDRVHRPSYPTQRRWQEREPVQEPTAHLDQPSRESEEHLETSGRHAGAEPDHHSRTKPVGGIGQRGPEQRPTDSVEGDLAHGRRHIYRPTCPGVPAVEELPGGRGDVGSERVEMSLGEDGLDDAAVPLPQGAFAGEQTFARDRRNELVVDRLAVTVVAGDEELLDVGRVPRQEEPLTGHAPRQQVAALFVEDIQPGEQVRVGDQPPTHPQVAS